MNLKPISFPRFPSRALPLTTIIKALGIPHREPVFMQCAEFLHVLRQQATMQERLLWRGRPTVLTNRSSLRFVEILCARIDNGSAHGSRPSLPLPLTDTMLQLYQRDPCRHSNALWTPRVDRQQVLLFSSEKSELYYLPLLNSSIS